MSSIGISTHTTEEVEGLLRTLGESIKLVISVVWAARLSLEGSTGTLLVKANISLVRLFRVSLSFQFTNFSKSTFVQSIGTSEFPAGNAWKCLKNRSRSEGRLKWKSGQMDLRRCSVLVYRNLRQWNKVRTQLRQK